MKRIRCPKCDNYIVFDETRYEAGSQLVFQCTECGKQFAIRLPVGQTPHAPGGVRRLPHEMTPAPALHSSLFTPAKPEHVGTLHVVESRFHKQQVLPLTMGDNTIGKYSKTGDVSCPIESCDPSLDLHHCVLNVSRDKHGSLKYTLRDGPSYTGTFVSNDILSDRERRVIGHGTLFTLGATSVILHTHDE